MQDMWLGKSLWCANIWALVMATKRITAVGTIDNLIVCHLQHTARTGDTSVIGLTASGTGDHLNALQGLCCPDKNALDQ